MFDDFPFSFTVKRRRLAHFPAERADDEIFGMFVSDAADTKAAKLMLTGKQRWFQDNLVAYLALDVFVWIVIHLTSIFIFQILFRHGDKFS